MKKNLDISIRPFEEGQVEIYDKVIMGSFGSAYHKDSGYRYDMCEENLLANPDTVVFLAWVNKKAVGTITVSILRDPFGPVVGYISAFGVIKEYRHHGIGTKLMDAVEDFCLERESLMFELYGHDCEDQKAAMAFYKNRDIKVQEDSCRLHYIGYCDWTKNMH